MEALAYTVGISVDLDLRAAGGLGQEQRLLDALATFTGDDAANAARYVVKRHPDNPIYRQNYRIERGAADHRIPTGGWQQWLGEIGFDQSAIEHVQAQASQGQILVVDEQEIES
jgi:predicted nucleic acid-binding Zn ribbon protein